MSHCKKPRPIVRVSTVPKIFTVNLSDLPYDILFNWKDISLVEGFPLVPGRINCLRDCCFVLMKKAHLHQLLNVVQDLVCMAHG